MIRASTMNRISEHFEQLTAYGNSVDNYHLKDLQHAYEQL